MMAPMMSRMMGGDPGTPESVTEDDRFEVMSFTVDANKTGSVQRLPTLLAGAPSVPDWGEPIIQRQFDLQMHVGGGGMRSMMGQGDITGLMGINGQSMDMSRVDTRAKVGQTELWKISSSEMAHPFHVHGTHFQVLSQNGQAVDFSETGLKDVVLVDGKADIFVRFSRTANDNAPYMYHCHILEYEDAGMMGQLTVS